MSEKYRFYINVIEKFMVFENYPKEYLMIHYKNENDIEKQDFLISEDVFPKNLDFLIKEGCVPIMSYFKGKLSDIYKEYEQSSGELVSFDNIERKYRAGETALTTPRNGASKYIGFNDENISKDRQKKIEEWFNKMRNKGHIVL